MKELPMSDKHREKLSEYGLQDMYPDSCRLVSYKAGETLLRGGDAPYLAWRHHVRQSQNMLYCPQRQEPGPLLLCIGGHHWRPELMTGLKSATTTIVAITDFECITISSASSAAKSNTVFLKQGGK